MILTRRKNILFCWGNSHSVCDIHIMPHRPFRAVSSTHKTGFCGCLFFLLIIIVTVIFVFVCLTKRYTQQFASRFVCCLIKNIRSFLPFVSSLRSRQSTLVQIYSLHFFFSKHLPGHHAMNNVIAQQWLFWLENVHVNKQSFSSIRVVGICWNYFKRFSPVLPLANLSMLLWHRQRRVIP